MTALTMVATAVVVTILAGPTLSPVRAQYCSERPGGCCPGRDDSCTAPIGDTFCYCDMFCLRSNAPDCCVDVFNNCTALPSPTTATPRTPKLINLGGCTYKDDYHFVGETFKDNCNTCTCLLTSVGEYEAQCENNVCLITKEIIERVNLASIGWRAGNYSFLGGLTLAEGTRRRLGTLRPRPVVAGMESVRVRKTTGLPASFDSRRRWPGRVGSVVDQGECGSSWAVSTTAVASDRLAIQTHGRMRLPLSSQNLLSCNFKGQKGCDGGHLDRAWYYLRKYGVVTDQCYPYRSGDANDEMKKGPCMLPSYKKTPCPNANVTSDKYKCTPPYRVSKKSEDIMTEIFDNGPVQALFLVKDDFYSYTSGVYRHVPDYENIEISEPNTAGGYHSVRVVGWGVDNTNPNEPLPYWLCANSWGTQWGEDGLFRILRGANECGIESFVIGVWANVDFDMMQG